MAMIARRPRARPSWRLLAASLVALGCAVVAGRAGLLGDHVDFEVYVSAGEAMARGANPYTDLPGLPFTYPPFALLLCIVAAHAPTLTLAGLELLAVAVSAFAMTRVSGARSLPIPALLTVAALAVVTEPVVRTLHLGQSNGLVMALVILDFCVLPRRFRGIATGLAAGLKLTPLLFLLVFLAQRRVADLARMLATVALTLAVMVLVPHAAPPSWTTLLRPARVGNPAFVDNQSLLGALRRALPEHVATPLWVLGSLLVIAITYAVLRGIRDRPPIDSVLVCALAGVLVSPISWSHHWVLAFPLAMGLTLQVMRTTQPRAGSRAARAVAVPVLVAVCAVLLAGPHWLLDRRQWESGPTSLGGQLLASSMTLAGIVLLLVALWSACRRRRRAGLDSAL